MSVWEDVLLMLMENRDTYLSGEELAGRLGVSRTAVWKAVNHLKKQGYAIEGVNKKGYRMAKGEDILSAEGIRQYLNEPLRKRCQIEVYDVLSSTNTVLKQRAVEGAGQGLVLIALEQTQGRGRMNRNFYSPSGTGIYMSLLFRPRIPAEKAVDLTTMTAVAVSCALDEIFQADTKIKWVNDIYNDKKKICGILTEASVDVETARLHFAVVGIGINVRQPEKDFPQEIQSIAGSMLNCLPEKELNDNLRNRIVAKIIENEFFYYDKLEERTYMDMYRKKSMLIGEDVYILTDENRESLHVIDVDDRARLVVRHDDGRIEYLQSGEVSVRMKE